MRSAACGSGTVRRTGLGTDLVAWTRMLACTGDAVDLAMCEPNALRHRFLHVAAGWSASAAGDAGRSPRRGHVRSPSSPCSTRSPRSPNQPAPTCPPTTAPPETRPPAAPAGAPARPQAKSTPPSLGCSGPQSVNHRGKAFKADLLPVRFHDLRHAAASVMLVSGTTMKVVSTVLGHSVHGDHVRRLHERLRRCERRCCRCDAHAHPSQSGALTARLFQQLESLGPALHHLRVLTVLSTCQPSVDNGNLRLIRLELAEDDRRVNRPSRRGRANV